MQGHVVTASDHLSVTDVLRLVQTLAERPTVDNEDVFTLDQVAEKTKVAHKTLLKECRAGRLEHVHRGQLRGMTREQIAKMLKQYTVTPGVVADATFDEPDEPTELQQAMDATRRIAARRRRVA